MIYDYELAVAAAAPVVPPGPSWTRHWLGENFYAQIYLVDAGTRLSRYHQPLTEVAGESGESPPQLTLDGIVSTLGELRHIRSLNLSGTLLTDEMMPFMAHLRSLRELQMDSVEITDEGDKLSRQITARAESFKVKTGDDWQTRMFTGSGAGKTYTPGVHQVELRPLHQGHWLAFRDLYADTIWDFSTDEGRGYPGMAREPLAHIVEIQ